MDHNLGAPENRYHLGKLMLRQLAVQSSTLGQSFGVHRHVYFSINAWTYDGAHQRLDEKDKYLGGDLFTNDSFLPVFISPAIFGESY